jgi:hypothetical protein
MVSLLSLLHPAFPSSRRAGIRENLNDCRVAVFSGIKQRRHAVIVCLVDVRARLDKRPCYFLVAVLSGVVPSFIALLTSAPASISARTTSSKPS